MGYKNKSETDRKKKLKCYCDVRFAELSNRARESYRPFRRQTDNCQTMMLYTRQVTISAKIGFRLIYIGIFPLLPGVVDKVK